MSRLQQYILGEDKKFQQISSMVQRDCKPFIKELKKSNSKKRPFFNRGTTSKTIDDFSKIKVRKDRKPRDTPLEVHNYLDNALKKKFGWKVRSEGVFATSQERTGYGTSYIFFPIGKYKYVFSTQILDLYGHLGGGYMSDGYLEISTNIEIINDAINTYKSSDMKEAMETMHEIIFKCDEYYMINMKYQNVLYKYIKEIV